MGLWALAGAWCARELTDGRLPKYMLEELAADEALAVALVESGLWYEETGEYVFHDWFDYQPSREDVTLKRKKNAARLQAWRDAKALENSVTDPPSDASCNAVTDVVTNGVTNSVSNALVTLPPTRPDPTRPDPLVTATKKRATKLGNGWKPNSNHKDYADANEVDLDHEVGQFRSHHLSKGSTFLDWDQAFRTWLGNANKWSRPVVAAVRKEEDVEWMR